MDDFDLYWWLQNRPEAIFPVENRRPQEASNALPGLPGLIQSLQQRYENAALISKLPYACH